MRGFLYHARAVILRAKDVVENSRSTFLTFVVVLARHGSVQFYLAEPLPALLSSTVMWLSLALFTGIAARGVSLRWRRYISSDESRKFDCLYHCLYAVVFLACFFSCICCLILPIRKPKWERTNQYFECKGVVNGVSKGTTWPVPTCFQEDREGSIKYKTAELLSPLSPAVTEMSTVLGCMLLLIIIVFYQGMLRNRQRHRATISPRRPDEAPEE